MIIPPSPQIRIEVADNYLFATFFILSRLPLDNFGDEDNFIDQHFDNIVDNADLSVNRVVNSMYIKKCICR